MSNRNIYNFRKRYRVLPDDMENLQNDWSQAVAMIAEGVFDGSIVSGLVPATGGALAISISVGMAFGPTGYVHNVTEVTEITVTPPTGSNYARSLIVARPSLTNNDYKADPENPLGTFPLRVELGSEVVLIAGVAASAPSYPATEANDVIVCGVRTYPGQTVVTTADLDMTVRDSMGKNAAYLQNAAQFDDRLRPYRSTHQILGIKPSQLSGSGPRQFKSSADNRATLFPKTPAGNFNANDTFLNFQTGTISGGDGASSPFTPTIPASGQCIVASVVLDNTDTLDVSFGTAGTRAQCVAAIENQTTTGAGAINTPVVGQPIAFVLLTSANGSTVTELDFWDARGILPGAADDKVTTPDVDGTANQVLGLDSAGTETEWKTIAGTSPLSVVHSGGLVTISMTAAGAAASGYVTTGIQSFAGAKTFVNDVVFSANLTVNGTLAYLNVDNLQVEDKNIEINYGGNAASAEGAGLSVLGNSNAVIGTLKWDSTLTRSKWKIGPNGTEAEVLRSGDIVNADIASGAAIAGSKIVSASPSVSGVVTAAAQSIGGQKTFDDGVLVRAGSMAIYDATDNTKRMLFDVSGNNSGVTTTFKTAGAASQIITYPGGSTTLGGLATSQIWTALNTFQSFLCMTPHDVSSTGTISPLTPTSSFVVLSGTGADITIRNITAGSPGQILVLLKRSQSNNLTVNHANAASTDIMTRTGSDLTLVGGGAMILIYEGTGSSGRWFVVAINS